MTHWSRLPWVILIVLFVGGTSGLFGGLWILGEGPLAPVFVIWAGIAVLTGWLAERIMNSD